MSDKTQSLHEFLLGTKAMPPDEPPKDEEDSESMEPMPDDEMDEMPKKETGMKRDIPQSARDEMASGDFAGPHQSYPIAKPEDVRSASRLIGKADNPDAVKRRIIAIAYRKGAAFVAQLPDDWKRSGGDMPEKSYDGEKALLERLWERISARLGTKDSDDGTGFKVVGNHWLTVWSNNFKDREGEMFTTKAMDDYVRRVDMGVVPPPELWDSHIAGTRSGQAEFVARHGHFMVALGTFDDTPKGHAAKAFYAKNAKQQGISHGFRFPTRHFDGEAYHAFNTFEISPLQRGAEANRFTSFEGIKEMALTEAKKKRLVEVFGKEQAEQILADYDEKGKALEALNVEYKEFVETDDAAGDKSDDGVLATALKELLPDLIGGQAEAIEAATEAVKAAKATDARMAKLEKALEKINAFIAQTPKRASAAKETELDPEDEADKAVIAQIEVEKVDEKAVKAFPGLFDTKSSLTNLVDNGLPIRR